LLLAYHLTNHYQIVHVHNMPDLLVFAALVPRLFGAKLVLHFHDLMPEVYVSKNGIDGGSAIVRLLRLQERLAAFFAHTVITANAAFKARLVERGVPASKITVVNNYPDPRVFSPQRHPKHSDGHGTPFTLLYPGGIVPRYGLNTAVRALPQLSTKIRQLRLIIVGPPTEHARELANLARALKVSAFIQIRPSVASDAVAQLMAEADVGIYPALPDVHMNIATPTKVLEYAAMGLPIIASRLPAVTNLFPDSAVLFFEAGDVDQFAACVLELYANPTRRKDLAENAAALLAAAYTWNSESRAYFHCLNQLLPSHIGPLVAKDSSVQPWRMSETAQDA
jgi:glycosyltransferase involved in cell wall biosynthesis